MADFGALSRRTGTIDLDDHNFRRGFQSPSWSKRMNKLKLKELDLNSNDNSVTYSDLGSPELPKSSRRALNIKQTPNRHHLKIA